MYIKNFIQLLQSGGSIQGLGSKVQGPSLNRFKALGFGL